MSRALQRQKLEAQEQAEATLKEVEEEEQHWAREEEDEARQGLSGRASLAAGTSGDPGSRSAGHAQASPAAAAQSGGGGGRVRFRGGGKVSTVPFGFEDLELDLKPFEISGGGGGAASDDDEGMRSDAEEDAEAKADRLRSGFGASASGGRGDDTLDQRSKQQQGSGKGKGKQHGGGRGGGFQPTHEELRDLAMALGEEDEDGGHGSSAAATMMMPLRIVEHAAASRPSSANASDRILREGLFSGADRIAVKAAGSGKTESGADFIAAAVFSGSRLGMVFRKGPKGLGYYPDPSRPSTVEKGCDSLGGKPSGMPSGKVVIAGGGGEAAIQKPSLPGVKQHQLQRKGLGESSADDGKGWNNDDDDDDDAGRDGAFSGSREGMRPAPGSKAAAQKDLIAMAFAGVYWGWVGLHSPSAPAS